MHKLKILIVEDDRLTRHLFQSKLERCDYEVVAVEDGDKALKLFENSFYDVVITDVVMPGNTDGMGVLEHSKKMHPDTDVIVMTGLASVQNAVVAMKKGAVDYLVKPVDIEELVIKLERIAMMKSLAKDALDLRSAMEQTEENAKITVRYQEMAIIEQRRKIQNLKDILTDSQVRPEERIAQALELVE